MTYVVNRNINYTNVCYFRCQFCAFSKGKMSENLRGKPYDLGLDEVVRRSAEAWDRGATEVCMQGGIHPEYTGQTYLDICSAVKDAIPRMHVHAFSPLEVWQGAATLGVTLEEFLKNLRDAGLGTLPGTAAEILDDEVRDILCPDKINTEQWLEVMETAHNVGFRTTATIMYGHMESSVNWARHLLRLRSLQERTGGFTEFVPLPFVHMEAPIYLKGRARRGPTFREAVLMHAVARLALHPHFTNIQVSWVKMGGDDHVWPHGELGELGSAPAPVAFPPRANRRLHRVRASTVRSHGSADLPEGPCTTWPDLPRSRADARRGAPGTTPALHQHPSLVGEDGWPGSEGLPERRSERSGRHSHERVDHSGRGLRTWPRAGPRSDGGADSQLRSCPQATQHGLWRGTGRTRGAVVRGIRTHTAHQPTRPPLRAGRIRRRKTR